MPEEISAHVVRFYDTSSSLVSEVADFLSLGHALCVIATPAHLESIEEELVGRGVDIDEHNGRYIGLDAQRTLDSLMVRGLPSSEKFEAFVANPIRRLGEAGPMRGFGEMVGLLWEAGNIDAVIALESLWERFIESSGISLYCAYPSSALEHGSLDAVASVCALHGHVEPPESYRGQASSLDLDPEAPERIFVPTVLAPRAVRRFVTETCRQWGLRDVVERAELVASELATNAVLHASSPFRVRLIRDDASITIEVTDCDPAPPAGRDAGLAPGGRGIPIVAAVSEWGVREHDDGKVVWARMSLSAHEAASRHDARR